MRYIKLFEDDREKWLEIDLLELCEYTGSLEYSIDILKKLKKSCCLNWATWDNSKYHNTISSADFTYSSNPEGIFLNNFIFNYDSIKLKKVRINFEFSYVTLTDEILPFINAKKYNI